MTDAEIHAVAVVLANVTNVAVEEAEQRIRETIAAGGNAIDLVFA